jgi:signal transduction histidine kinase
VGVRLTTGEAGIVLAVQDKGPGVPAEFSRRIFEKFFRVPSGDRHNIKGHGLGLSYAADVVSQHGGTIGVESVEGGGCVFTVKLPPGPVS